MDQKKEKGCGTRYSAKTREEARELYENGTSVMEISRRLGPTPKVVRGWLLAMGVEMRCPERIYDRKAVLKDIKRFGVTAAARIHGCSHRFASDLKTGRIKP
jgi:transposase-like protein